MQEHSGDEVRDGGPRLPEKSVSPMNRQPRVSHRFCSSYGRCSQNGVWSNGTLRTTIHVRCGHLQLVDIFFCAPFPFERFELQRDEARLRAPRALQENLQLPREENCAMTDHLATNFLEWLVSYGILQRNGS